MAEEILRRIAECFTPAAVDEGAWALLPLATALALVLTPAWYVARVLVVVVHEGGHALVGKLFGRKLNALVVRPDMSGHAVTSGPSRGIGLVMTTLAGYPAPAWIGALLAWTAFTGWAHTVLFVSALLCLLALLKLRSVYTFLAFIGIGTTAGLLWWSRIFALEAGIVLGVALVLLCGAWRHLWVLITRGGPGDDAGALARITPVPTAAWNAIIFTLIALPTWWVGTVAFDVGRAYAASLW